MECYSNSVEHILAELERIDLLIRAQVWRARQVHQTDEAFQGLYISDQEIDDLMGEPAGLPRWATAPGPLAMAEVRSALDHVAHGVARRKADCLFE